MRPDLRPRRFRLFEQKLPEHEGSNMASPRKQEYNPGSGVGVSLFCHNIACTWAGSCFGRGRACGVVLEPWTPATAAGSCNPLCAYSWAVMGMAIQPNPASESNLLALPDGT